MPSTTSSSGAPRRNPVLVTIDVLVSILLGLLVAVLALGVVTTALSFSALSALCADGAADCNPGLLNAVIYGLVIVAVIVAALGIGMVIVSFIRKRYAFGWPLGAIAIILVAFYAGTWLAGTTVPSA